MPTLDKFRHGWISFRRGAGANEEIEDRWTSPPRILAPGAAAVAVNATDPFHGLRVSVVVPMVGQGSDVSRLFPLLPDGLHEVVVVDGDVVVPTAAAARRLRPDLRVVAVRAKGKGDALARGFAASTGDVIVTLDADGAADPADIVRFVDAIAAGADVAKGSRFLPGGGSANVTVARRLGNRLLSASVNLLYGTKYTDLCYGCNAFRAHWVKWITPDRPSVGVETLINVRVAKIGLKVAEVPSFEGRRVNGMSNVRPVRDGVQFAAVILRERFTRTRRRPRFPLGESVTVAAD